MRKISIALPIYLHFSLGRKSFEVSYCFGKLGVEECSILFLLPLLRGEARIPDGITPSSPILSPFMGFESSFLRKYILPWCLPTIGVRNSFYLSEDLVAHVTSIANSHSKGNDVQTTHGIAFTMKN